MDALPHVGRARGRSLELTRWRQVFSSCHPKQVLKCRPVLGTNTTPSRGCRHLGPMTSTPLLTQSPPEAENFFKAWKVGRGQECDRTAGSRLGRKQPKQRRGSGAVSLGQIHKGRKNQVRREVPPLAPTRDPNTTTLPTRGKGGAAVKVRASRNRNRYQASIVCPHQQAARTPSVPRFSKAIGAQNSSSTSPGGGGESAVRS